MYVLGIDGGGTKTVCVVMDENSHVISRSESGAGNYQSVGEKTAFSSIEEAIKQATIPIGKIEVKAIGFGLAGVARPRDFQVVQEWFDKLQKSDNLNLLWEKCGNYIVHHDAYTALVRGIGKREGIVVNSGTGAYPFRQQFEFSLSKLLPNSQVIYPRHEPAYGAAWLALQTVLH